MSNRPVTSPYNSRYDQLIQSGDNRSSGQLTRGVVNSANRLHLLSDRDQNSSFRPSFYHSNNMDKGINSVTTSLNKKKSSLQDDKLGNKYGRLDESDQDLVQFADVDASPIFKKNKNIKKVFATNKVSIHDSSAFMDNDRRS